MLFIKTTSYNQGIFGVRAASGIGVVTMEARWRSTTNISHWIFWVFWVFRVLTKYGKHGKYGKPIILFAISP